MKLYISVFFCVAIALLTIASQGLEAATVEVQMTSSLQFEPADVTINVGDTIRWRNAGGGVHTTTSGENCMADGLWNAMVFSGQTFDLVFTEAGVFPYFCDVAFHCESGMIGSITVNQAVPMSLPQSQETFAPPLTSTPILNADPAQANPLGVGSVALGGDSLEIQIGTTAFSGPAEIYFAVYSPQILGNDIFLFSEGVFQPYAVSGLVPWIASTTGPLDESLFGVIPLSAFQPGAYTLYLAVAPAGSSLATFYLWSADFTAP